MANTRKRKPSKSTPSAATRIGREDAVRAFIGKDVGKDVGTQVKGETPIDIQKAFVPPSHTVLRTKQDGFYHLDHTFTEAMDILDGLYGDGTELYDVSDIDMVMFKIADPQASALAIKVSEITCIVDTTPKPLADMEEDELSMSEAEGAMYGKDAMCEECDGTGVCHATGIGAGPDGEDVDSAYTCSDCDGTGRVEADEQYVPGPRKEADDE